MDTEKIFVDGEFVEGTNGGWREILNPATGEIIAAVPECTEEDVDRAVLVARGAFENWFETTPAERSRMLNRLADALEDHAEELALTGPEGGPQAALRDRLDQRPHHHSLGDAARWLPGVGLR